MNFTDIKQLEQFGFIGFKSIKELQSNPSILPSTPGVYLILRPDKAVKEFLEIGCGGHFKGKNPNVGLTELISNWVDNTKVLYIGKAGGLGRQATLKSRLKQYLDFGKGKPVGHWGGRLIWQLKNSNELIICWKPLITEEPREFEGKLIQLFYSRYNKRPFANLAD
jgi:hypothetical protein